MALAIVVGGGLQIGCESSCHQCELTFRRCSADGRYLELCQVDPLSACRFRAIQSCSQGACSTSGGVPACESCGSPCQPGQVRCSGNILERCEQTAACVQFATVKICSGGCDPTTGSCIDNTPDGGPPPGCTRTNPTAKRGCVGNAVHWLDNCDVPTQKIAECQAGTRCTGGRCFAPCQGDCPQEGAKQCQGTGFVTCEKAADGCTYWSKIEPCSSRKCANGQCQGSACTERCPNPGAKKCDGAKLVTCQSVASDCNEWSAPADCPNGTGCVNGECVPGSGCNHECGIGMTRCAGNLLQTCEADARGCFLYNAGTPCPSGQRCENGSCL